MKIVELNKCVKFLEANGWSLASGNLNEEYLPYYRERYIGVEVSRDEIVFITDNGDDLHMPVSYYALVGALMEWRQIDCGYVGVSLKDANEIKGEIAHWLNNQED